MTTLGIDLGAYGIRVAQTDSVAATPTNLALGPNGESILPLCIETDQSRECTRSSWECYPERFNHLGMVFGFRDGFQSRAIAGKTSDELLSYFFQKSLTGTLPSYSGLAVAIPDTWSNSRWDTLTTILHSGYSPTFVVREWQAVAALQPALLGSDVVFLSAGYGSCRATHCVVEDDMVVPQESITLNQVSGAELREKLLDRFSREIIEKHRKDPRENRTANAVLRLEIDRLLNGFLSQSDSQAQLAIDCNLFDFQFRRAIDANEIAEWAEPIRREFLRQMQHFFKERRLSKPHVIIWGELAFLLPLKNWIKTFCNGHLTRAPLDAVPCGAAKLAAAYHEGNRFSSGDMDVLNLQERRTIGSDGNLADGHANIGVLRQFSASHLGISVAGGGVVTQLNQGTRKSVGRSLIFGRDPKAHWVFQSEINPEVSFKHCEIKKEGTDFIICDLDSTNGTFLNGNRVTQAVLNDGDQFQFGETGPEFQFTKN